MNVTETPHITLEEARGEGTALLATYSDIVFDLPPDEQLLDLIVLLEQKRGRSTLAERRLLARVWYMVPSGYEDHALMPSFACVLNARLLFARDRCGAHCKIPSDITEHGSVIVV